MRCVRNSRATRARIFSRTHPSKGCFRAFAKLSSLPARPEAMRRRNVVAWNQWRTDKTIYANLYFWHGLRGVCHRCVFCRDGTHGSGVEPTRQGGPHQRRQSRSLRRTSTPHHRVVQNGSFRATGDWEQASRIPSLPWFVWARRAAAMAALTCATCSGCANKSARPGKTCGALHRGHSQHGDAWYDGQSRHPRLEKASGRKVGRDFGCACIRSFCVRHFDPRLLQPAKNGDRSIRRGIRTGAGRP